MTVIFLLAVTVVTCLVTAFFLTFGIKEDPRDAQRRRTFEYPRHALSFRRARENPVLPPGKEPWEAEAVMNPAALYDGLRTHLLYRAIGADGVSRLGYASSGDGVAFDERLPYPVFVHENPEPKAGAKYDPGMWGSGGSWSGVEDPRAVLIDDRVYVTYNAFNGWNSMRVALTSISLPDLLHHRWNFSAPRYLSPKGERHKNWVLFPEKIGGKFALFHNLHAGDPSRVRVDYVENILAHDPDEARFNSPDPQSQPDRLIGWHHRMRSIGPPPIRTPFGWLSLYHAMDPKEPGRYKMGAIVHDERDPSRVIARAPVPVLEPEAHYEAQAGAKPGVVYACGAVVKDDELRVYYGSADSFVCMATTPIRSFVHAILRGSPAPLTLSRI